MCSCCSRAYALYTQTYLYIIQVAGFHSACTIRWSQRLVGSLNRRQRLCCIQRTAFIVAGADRELRAPGTSRQHRHTCRMSTDLSRHRCSLKLNANRSTRRKLSTERHLDLHMSPSHSLKVTKFTLIMDARSAMRPCYILPMFFFFFYARLSWRNG